MGEKEHIIKGIKKFIKRLSQDFSIEKIILFGSRATNKFKGNSDIDLIIVSKDFEGKNFFERVTKMYDYWDLDYPVDFLCYTQKEFNLLSKRISIAKEALDKGVVFA